MESILSFHHGDQVEVIILPSERTCGLKFHFSITNILFIKVIVYNDKNKEAIFFLNCLSGVMTMVFIGSTLMLHVSQGYPGLHVVV